MWRRILAIGLPDDALLLAAEGSLTRAKDDEKERFAGPGDSI